jgi:hypothetical protein
MENYHQEENTSVHPLVFLDSDILRICILANAWLVYLDIVIQTTTRPYVQVVVPDSIWVIMGLLHVFAVGRDHTLQIIALFLALVAWLERSHPFLELLVKTVRLESTILMMEAGIVIIAMYLAFHLRAQSGVPRVLNSELGLTLHKMHAYSVHLENFLLFIQVIPIVNHALGNRFQLLSIQLLA